MEAILLPGVAADVAADAAADTAPDMASNDEPAVEDRVYDTVLVALLLAPVSTTLPVNESVVVVEPSALVNVATPTLAVTVSVPSGITVPSLGVQQAIRDHDTIDAAGAEVVSGLLSSAEATVEMESS